MAKIYYADGRIEEVQPRNGRDFELGELHKIVGGYIEVLLIGKDQIMVVNEEGKLMELPINIRATELYGHDTIVGDALVCNNGEVR